MTLASTAVAERITRCRIADIGRRSNVSVGTTQRSIAAMVSAWLRRNVRQVCDGGPRRRIMYLETVDSATSNPSMARRAPQWVLLAHPLDEFAQLTANSGPSWPTARFPAPIAPKSCSMPPQDLILTVIF